MQPIQVLQMQNPHVKNRRNHRELSFSTSYVVFPTSKVLESNTATKEGLYVKLATAGKKALYSNAYLE